MSTVLLWVVGILAAAIGVAISIALHEVGHLLPAKRFGVRVTQYMVGFGPTLWSRRRGETEYGVKAIPLGGYIRMIGMFPPGPDGRLRASSTGRWALMAEEARQASFVEVGPGEEHRAFYRQAVGKRILIMLGGPLVNLVLGFVLMGVALSGIGLPTGSSTTVGVVQQCVLPADTTATTCPADATPTPGAAAGLRPGDRFVSFDGQPVTGWVQLSNRIRDAGGREVTLVVERDGRQVTLTATPLLTQRPVLDADGRPTNGTVEAGFLGVSPTAALERVPVSEVPGIVGQQLQGTAGIVLNLPQRLYGVAQAAFGTQQRDPNGPIGIVGIGRLAGELNAEASLSGDAFAERAGRIVSLLASLNIALFVFNMIPLLPFDGGHIAGALWEVVKKALFRVRRRPDPGPVDVAKAMPLAYGVSILLVGMSVLLLYADIVRPVTLNQ
ncbi:M50 family metallopeptidase [Kineococcus rhizosphaerae]|uniref:RIP metalloprotease RseP n=1 Tax=Kineococcus rhizosphaerae TaxID=559628 RepID=A0A2T0RBN0_9ACTN|nr:site-2 protease family protein [Kineococcus rhizosphaerae]PRY18575.1 RIP metalloprotease RseP [Kineococcus rhizosphaerae]